MALCTATKAKLHSATQDETKDLHTRAEAEETANVSGDLTEILFDIIQSKTQPEICINALKVLLGLSMMNVRGSAFAAAADILGRLRALAVDQQFDHELRSLIVEQLASLADPARLATIVETLKNDDSADSGDLARFLHMLPAAAAPALCELMEIERYEGVAREDVGHLVKEDPTVLTSRLGEPNVEMAKNILGILERVAEPDLAVVLVDPLLAAETPVKEASVKLLARLKGSASRDLLLNYVADDEPRLRQTALKALSTFEGGGSATALRQQVLAKDFDHRSLQEKKTLLVTLAKLEGARVQDFLVDVLNQRRWFERGAHAETRACAALALREIDSDVARAALEAHASDKAEAVRTATRLALDDSAQTLATGS